MHERITLRTNTIVTANRVLGRVFVVVIVKRLTPVGRLLTLKEWEERTALNVRRHLCTSYIEEGWGIVDILYHLFDNPMLTARIVNQQWCAE